MAKQYPAYGVKKDYPKIDIYGFPAFNKPYGYLASTTWARTCKQAVEKFNESHGAKENTAHKQARAVRAFKAKE